MLLDWILDKDVGHVAMFDPSAIIMIQGPRATSVYRDEVGQNNGIIIRDKWKLTQKDKLRIANGGHIITEDADGNLKVFCKKRFLKFGKKRIPVSHKFYAHVTDDSITMVACAVCARFVEVREQIINYQWSGKFLNGSWWS